MSKKYFISIEEMKKHKAYDSIGDWLLDLEKTKIKKKILSEKI